MRKTLLAAMALALLIPLSAFGQAYSFGEKPNFTNIIFESSMDLEDIVGSSNSLSGSATISGDGGSFSFEVPVDSLKTGIDLRDEHLRGEYWFDSKKFPKISFKGETLKKISDGVYEATGKFEIKGVAKELTVKLSTKIISKETAKAAGLDEVEFMKVKGEFSLKLSDFGIKIPDMAAAKVNDLWTIKLSLYGKLK
jgi:polyisoprenoid-binding protein YceI